LLRPRFRPARWIKSRPNFSKKRSSKYIRLPRLSRLLSLPRRRNLFLPSRHPLPSWPKLLQRLNLPLPLRQRPKPSHCLNPRRRQCRRKPLSRRRHFWPRRSCRWPRLKFQSRPALRLCLRLRFRLHPKSARRLGLCNCRKSRPPVRQSRDHPLVARRRPAKQNLSAEAICAGVPVLRRLRPGLLCPGKDRPPKQAHGLPGPRPRLPNPRKKSSPSLPAS